MLLTKRTLNKILQDWRVSIPAELKKELLYEYGNFVTDDEGHVFEYTEQDICEQLRKKLRPYENHLRSGQLSQAAQADRERGLDAAKERERQHS